MSDQAQQHKPAGPVVGRRDDPAEARVEQRLSAEPGLAALHGGALGPAPARAPDAAPQPATVPQGGRPLDRDLRSQMEGAFGERFGDVRLHTGPEADQTARALNSTAFAQGRDIGFARGAFRPETPHGRGIIAHELAHVSEQRRGADDPGTIRRVGEYRPGGTDIIENFARWFGGGSFTDAELALFINAMARESYEFSAVDHADTDNMAREIASRVFGPEATADTRAALPPAVQSVRVRLNMIRHMLSGHVAGSDSEAVLQILRAASDIDRRQIVRLYGEQAILSALDSQQANELATLLGLGVEPSGGGSQGGQTVPVRWEINTTLNSTPVLGSQLRGIMVKNMKHKPQGLSAFRDLRNNLMVPGRNATDVPITTGAAHPIDQGGQASMAIWVVPQDPADAPAYAFATDKVIPAKPYPTVNAVENQEIEANLDVQLGASTIGEIEQQRANERGSEERRGGSQTNSHEDRQDQGTRQRVEDRRDTTDTDTSSIELSNDVSTESMRAVELEESWNRSVQQSHQDLVTMETGMAQSTTDTTSTELEIGASLSAEAMTALRATLGITGSGSVGLEDIGSGLIGTVLAKLPAAPARVLGGLLSLVDGVSAGLEIGLSGDVGSEGQLTVGGTLNGRAARLWSEARTRSFNIGRSSTTSDETVEQEGTGGAERRSQEEREGSTRGARAVHERARQSSLGRSVESEASQSSGSTDTISETQSFEDMHRRSSSSSVTLRRNLLVPKVDSANLSFRVVRNPYGEVDPVGVAPEQERGSQGAQQAEDG
ncbi:DUF4157 domain-containing protein [Poseidonocella sedimentorum]|uniref:eCIS core domain-containing protein n=1 Tax=Poseidonocella sedimentorum TaxID=871652 RepID=A0A1I6DP77_9RHOB|nr:DUF4157 domain-containing protein [Poseidonocella sedimentorum]SFR07239.1 protein of unknown function [Poseidonocella sedimentorum]